MARNAKDIYDVIAKNRIQLDKDNKQYTERCASNLSAKCISAISEMMKACELQIEIDITDDDLVGISDVTAKMRELDYRYCLIEAQNKDGAVIDHRLRISIAHLEKNND